MSLFHKPHLVVPTKEQHRASLEHKLETAERRNWIAAEQASVVNEIIVNTKISGDDLQYVTDLYRTLVAKAERHNAAIQDCNDQLHEHHNAMLRR